MKKEYYLLFMLILLEIFAITTQSSTCGSLNPTKADDCKDDTLIQSQKDADFVHCCYKQYIKKVIIMNVCLLLRSNIII